MPDSPALAAPSSVTFADLLRHHRTAAGLTQEELAARAGLSSDAISTLERGARRRPRKDTVALLAAALALPDEERAAFAASARRSPAATLAATPPGDTAADLNGHTPALGSDATLPHGVVTFLFADIEDSTRLLHQLGDRYAGVLAEVQALLRDVWAAHAGHELGTQGDRFFAVFAYADDALAAAAAAQQALAANNWPPGAQVRLRMGVHSGAALLTAGRYVGSEVHRAARIAAAGHGGQVVVSRAVADQVTKFGSELPGGTSLRDLGKHRLQDLPHREELSQLVLPDLPGLAATYPPLRTLDAWPGLRADLTVVVGMSAALLTVVGLLLALLVPAFPWAIGLGTAALALLVLLGAVLAQPVRHALETQWRDARKPFASVVSALLSLVVVSTTLFITKPPIFIGPKHLGYNFSYTYHRPTHTGGAITLGMFASLYTLAPDFLGVGSFDLTLPLWQGCVVQLPDLTLGLDGWKADQCTQVPTVVNGGETPDEKTTTFLIDPRAVWSDGVPITADDFLFAAQLAQDPAFSQSLIPLFHWHLTALDAHTVRIQWPTPTADYLADLAWLTPLPLHVYATGTFAGVYNPRTGAYNSTLAQQLVASPSFYGAIPVDNGPFTVQSFSRLQQAVLVKNPHFFSNFFHQPALDQMTLVSAFKNYAAQMLQGQQPAFSQVEDDLIAGYRSGAYAVADGLEPLNLREVSGIPANQVDTSPIPSFLHFGFNQRSAAPNAQANGGTSIFADRTVRQAFIEAFDRCTAVRALLHISTCADPNLFTDEPVNASFPDYDPTFHLPSYNPAEAASLLTGAGYRVVNGIRRYKDGTTPLQLKLVLSPAAAPSSALATSIQQDWQKNLDVGVSISTGALYAPDCQSVWCSGAFDLLMSNYGALPDPVGYLTLNYGPFDTQDIPSARNPSALNGFGIIDPYVGQQDQLGSQTLDASQRIGVYRALDHYFAQQFYMQVLYVKADVTLTKRTLCNFKKWPAVGENLWNAADWYVASSCPS